MNENNSPKYGAVIKSALNWRIIGLTLLATVIELAPIAIGVQLLARLLGYFAGISINEEILQKFTVGTVLFLPVTVKIWQYIRKTPPENHWCGVESWGTNQIAIAQFLGHNIRWIHYMEHMKWFIWRGVLGIVKLNAVISIDDKEVENINTRNKIPILATVQLEIRPLDQHIRTKWSPVDEDRRVIDQLYELVTPTLRDIADEKDLKDWFSSERRGDVINAELIKRMREGEILKREESDPVGWYRINLLEEVPFMVKIRIAQFEPHPVKAKGVLDSFLQQEVAANEEAAIDIRQERLRFRTNEFFKLLTANGVSPDVAVSIVEAAVDLVPNENQERRVVTVNINHGGDPEVAKHSGDFAQGLTALGALSQEKIKTPPTKE